VRIATIMDPIESVLVERDTSFALMLEGQLRGHEVLYIRPADLWTEGPVLRAVARQVNLRRTEPPAHASLGDPRDVALGDVDAILVRTDPPFDQAYLQVTQMLDLVRDQTLVVNDPRGLRNANEKLYALHFADFMPRTMVTTRTSDVRRFVDEVGGRGVIKPLNGAGGRGVLVLDRADLNFNALVELSSDEGRRPVMVQEFLPEVRDGDKRILVLDGEPLGAILRVPRADEARSNLHVGGRAEPTTLTTAERHLVDAMAGRLQADGLFFVGLDVIGGKLTEVNVTSPTGIQELERFDGSQPARRVLEWLECRATSIKATAETRVAA
jgi:glutathione synthase